MKAISKMFASLLVLTVGTVALPAQAPAPALGPALLFPFFKPDLRVHTAFPSGAYAAWVLVRNTGNGASGGCYLRLSTNGSTAYKYVPPIAAGGLVFVKITSPVVLIKPGQATTFKIDAFNWVNEWNEWNNYYTMIQPPA